MLRIVIFKYYVLFVVVIGELIICRVKNSLKEEEFL